MWGREESRKRLRRGLGETYCVIVLIVSVASTAWGWCGRRIGAPSVRLRVMNSQWLRAERRSASRGGAGGRRSTPRPTWPLPTRGAAPAIYWSTPATRP